LEDLALLENPETRDAVLSLLVHVAFSDGLVQDDEFTYLQQLVPRSNPSELLAEVTAIAERPLDCDALARALPDEPTRWRALNFAARMAWMDRQLTRKETAVLLEAANGLGLPGDAVETVLREIVGIADHPVSRLALDAALRDFAWDDLVWTTEPPRSGLARSLPEGVRVIGTILLDGVEQIVITDRGMAAGFREGDGWVHWADVVRYTRVPVFGAAVKIETRDFRARTLVDPRLQPIGSLLDRIYSL
jgi:hypothetical protein